MPQTANHSTTWRFLRAEGQPPLLRVAVVIAFLAGCALVIVRVANGIDHPGVEDDNDALVDFHNVVYFPVIAFRDGVSPYSAPYAALYPVNRQYPLYSPAMFWLHYPFALLPIEIGNVVYFAMSIGLVLLLAVTALVVCRVPRTLCNVLGLAALILLSRPGHINLLLGQVALPMALGSIWSLELARRRPILAGFALALTTLKPTFGVPFVWLLFCRGNYRAVFAGVIIAALAAVGGLAPLVANHGLQSVLESLKQSQTLHESDPMVAPVTTWTRVDTLAVVGKLLGREPEPMVGMVVAAACLLVAGAAVFRIRRTPYAEGADSLSALIISTAALACIYHATYDALLLVPLWVGSAVGQLRWQLPPKLRPVVWILLTIPAANYLAARTFTRLFSIDGTLWTTLSMLNSLCVLFALLISIAVALLWVPRQSRELNQQYSPNAPLALS